MHINDAVFLEDLCPKFRLRQWRKSIHRFTGKSCIYCGKPSESIDHVIPRSQGGLSTTENCVPACLSCNGDKSDENALYWYRRQQFSQKIMLGKNPFVCRIIHFLTERSIFEQKSIS